MVSQFVKSKLVEAAWRAASHVSEPAMLAILFIVRRRTEADGGRWLKNIQIIPEHNQEPFEDEIINDPAFRRLEVYAEEVMEGTRHDNLTNGAIFWSITGNEPLFYGTKEQVACVGNMVLYK